LGGSVISTKAGGREVKAAAFERETEQQRKVVFHDSSKKLSLKSKPQYFDLGRSSQKNLMGINCVILSALSMEGNFWEIVLVTLNDGLTKF